MAGDGQYAGTDEDGGRKAKRARVTVACVGCRRKKERCDGTHPACQSCRSQGKQCIYPVREKKRGLRLGYVRSLEVLLGLLFKSVDGAESSAVALLQGGMKASNAPLKNPTTSKTNLFADVWRQSDAALQLNEMLASVESKEIELVDDRLDAVFEKALNQCQSTGGIEELGQSHSALPTPASSHPTHEISTTLAVEQPSPLHFNSPENLPRAELESESMLSPIPSSNTSPSSISRLPLGWHRYIKSYHGTLHTWFPIIPKQDIWRYAHILGDTSPSVQSPQLSAGELACLWAVVSCASYRDSSLPAGDANSPESLSHHAAMLVRDSIALCMGSDTYFEMGHVQALLVFVVHHLMSGSLSQAWLLLGRAVYMAVDLGLFKPGSSTRPGPMDDKTERVYLGCLVLDTLVALCMGRRPYLQTRDLHSIGLSNINGIEEWELSSLSSASDVPVAPMPARILSSFNNFVMLIGLVNDLVTLPPDAFDKQRISSILQRIMSSYSSFNRTTPSYPQTLNISILFVMVILILWSKIPSLLGTAESLDLTAMLRDLLKTALAGLQECEYEQLSPLYDIYLHILVSILSTKIAQAPYEMPELLQLKRKLQDLCAAQAKCRQRSNGITEAVNGTINNQLSSVDSGNISLNATLRDVDSFEPGESELYNSLSLLGSSDWEVPTLGFLEKLGVPHDTIAMNDQDVLNTYICLD
ncbi:hypothetical protein F4678DRAFT_276167 [Xylaria arbuscula]|nr:hypothetical protein F4678DRAFT_276167 [Xylaria arbuscula]